MPAGENSLPKLDLGDLVGLGTTGRHDLDEWMQTFRHEKRERPLERALDAGATTHRHGLRGSDA